MGICYSSAANRKRKTEWEDSEYGNGNPDFKLKTSSGDLATFLSKLGGGAEERPLHQIPGRLFSNGSSSVASLFTQQGKKGTNQDAMIVWENLCSRGGVDATFCGVFDGHGPYGHMVARKVRDALPMLLRCQWESQPENGEICGNLEGMRRFDDFMDEDGCESVEGEDSASEGVPEMHIPLKKSIMKAFKLMDKELKLHPSIDCFCSGSTAVALIKQGEDLIIGNVGDSRAILATHDEDNALEAVQLTVDLKPNLPREAARIQRCKGRVFALQDEPEVARVWLPNSDTPGLAMARAFGDFCLKDFGLISMPDVYHHHITERDEFVILATDGVWDVLSNKEAVDIVATAPGRSTAARALVDCATRAWRLKYPASKNDDCAVVCLFLKAASAPDAPKSHSENATNIHPEEEPKRVPSETNSDDQNINADASHPAAPAHSPQVSGEITPVVEDKPIDKTLGQSKRSLAEFISTEDDGEWSALEGITRVNSLLSIPRFLPFDRRSLSWRKWL